MIVIKLVIGVICKESRAVHQQYFSTQTVTTVVCNRDSETCVRCRPIRQSDPRHTAESDRAPPQRFIDKSIGERRRRLQCVVYQNDGHIEHIH